MADMTDILNLVRSGKLVEATESIQARLSGTPASQPDRPMKDVTPQARALPGPASPKRAKTMRPKRPVTPGKDRQSGSWSRQSGALPYGLFTPDRPQDDAPLIVMLHGCTQTPEDFSTGTRMNAAAAQIGAHVIWPEQSRAANANLCWNWFEPGHQGRGGEPAAIASVIKATLTQVGDRPVHVAGLSAGGAMAAVLGTHYSDLVSSVGVHSGLPAGCARDVGSAFSAMGSGGQGRAPLAVPAIVFHGDRDRTVAPANGTAILSGGGTMRTVTTGGRTTRVTVMPTTGHSQPSELWQVDGLAHAWSGGDRSGSHADPAGPDATAEMLRFFQAHR
ncbi:PHB depolymerase family esterase [Jannaschia sp. M317]|uniref:extracellular catalytic domain type 1 short-chain-length polyhydroxyalkanoate depolymerase n=1 Tax=Jannaschia sp. M317 TaxID=2867011 RepID=UPI0021A7C438|nr:PHB depolymerase family esterase [Jannaschia sp. M317]UWQ18305.1 PHB depolymerase family esterase [Jannaschia sp. M317]